MNSAFPRYTAFDPAVPVWCITPDLDRTIHRFFDTSPISPSGRYVGLTRLPYEDRATAPGDKAEVVLVDLEEGTQRIVAETCGWDTQLGAQVQWGADDTQLCYNDLDAGSWRPYGVVLNPRTGERREVEHGIYMVSRDGRWAASPCLLRTARTQRGYGVLAPAAAVPRNRGPAEDDGVYLTDLASGKCKLLVSFRAIADAILPDEDFEGGACYGVHVKWTPAGDRLMLVLRWVPDETFEGGALTGRTAKKWVVTLRNDGSDIRCAIPSSEWNKGGHHPDWCPDGRRVLINLKIDGASGPLRFVEAGYDGSDYRAMTESVLGSGHPSLHTNGRQILTDSYPGEPVAFGDGTVPIRLVDIEAGTERLLARMPSKPPFTGHANEFRVDPHPAWDRTYTRAVFNGFVDGTRRVFLADVDNVLRA